VGAHLETVFAGITTASDVEVEPVEWDKGRLAESQTLEIEGGQTLQVCGSFGTCCPCERSDYSGMATRLTLQSEQTPFIQHLKLYRSQMGALARVPLCKLGSEPSEVGVATPGVRDDVVGGVGVFRDDGVIYDAALFIQ
jgi:hypothetical protein